MIKKIFVFTDFRTTFTSLVFNGRKKWNESTTFSCFTSTINDELWFSNIYFWYFVLFLFFYALCSVRGVMNGFSIITEIRYGQTDYKIDSNQKHHKRATVIIKLQVFRSWKEGGERLRSGKRNIVYKLSYSMRCSDGEYWTMLDCCVWSLRPSNFISNYIRTRTIHQFWK